MTAPSGLLPSVRNYLDITWEDPATDEKLLGIIARGMAYVNRIAGGERDYAVEDAPRALLLDYCRYARSNALQEFEKDFLPELIALQVDAEVAAYEADADIQ